MSESTQEALTEYRKRDRRFSILLGIFLSYLAIVATTAVIMLFVQQSTIAHNQKANAIASAKRFQAYTEDNAHQHQITQQYITCIAKTLLLTPIEERTDVQFNKCSATGRQQPIQSSEAPDSSSGSSKMSFSSQPQSTPTVQPQQSDSSQNPQPAPQTPQPGLIQRIISGVTSIL